MNTVASLRRSLNLPQIVLYGLGNILGAGIYVLVGKVAGEAGYLAPVSFLLACLLAGITAFSFCELTARFPHSAGTAIYIEKGFQMPLFSVVVGLLVILTGVVSAATMARGFAGYLGVFVDLPPSIVISLLLGTLTALAIWGIGESVTVAAVITALEVLGLLLILWVTAPVLAEFPARQAELIPDPEWSIWSGIFGGAFLAFYAYVGFEDMVILSEEVKNTRRNMPIAILLALGIAAVIYVLIALNAVLTLSPEALQTSSAPLADVYQAATAQNPWLISMVSLIAVVNGALIQIIMGSRVSYGLAKQGLISPLFAKVNPHTQTPILATCVVSAVVLIGALWLPIETLARITSYLLLLLFSLVNLALIRIKRHDSVRLETFSVPLIVPILGFSSSTLFLALQTWTALMSPI